MSASQMSTSNVYKQMFVSKYQAAKLWNHSIINLYKVSPCGLYYKNILTIISDSTIWSVTYDCNWWR